MPGKGNVVRQKLDLGVRAKQADLVASVLKLRMKTVFSRFAAHGKSKKKDIFTCASKDIFFF